MSFSLPTNCPSCNSVLIWKGVDLACENNDCPTKKVMSLESFLLKCGVEGVTETSLTNWGITGFRSMLHFKSDGSKAQNKLISELNRVVFSKTKEELFGCMTFDGAGRKTIDKIIEFYGNGDLTTATETLYIYKKYDTFPEGIGQTIIDKIAKDWHSNVYVLSFIIKDARWNPIVKVVTASTGKLSGKSFLITGTLTEGRKSFEKLITDNSGTLASSVSKNLTYLIVGADAGSKLDKAKKLGITILTEDEFKGMI